MNIENYSFLAIRGSQGSHTYYLTQCPLRLVPRLFLFDEIEVPAALRQIQSLTPARVAALARYLAEEPTGYVLAPLVVVIDCEVTFDPLQSHLPEVGQLRIPLTARIVIQDGQHRRAAIEQVLSESPTLGDDMVPVMMFSDPQLTRAAQLYADLNQPQKRRTQSQRVLHDQDSPLAALVRQLVKDVPLFRGLTELEKTTISNRSTALFTLSAVYQATQALLGVGRRDPISETQVDLAQRFWKELGQTIPEWEQVIQGKVKAAELRKNYVHAHGVALLAIGHAGHILVETHPGDWLERLSALERIDWSRENTALWEGRAMVRGRMSKERDSVLLTASALKHALGLPLTEKEQAIERRLTASVYEARVAGAS
jgi:DNA sulfur modification protein DndB